MNLDKLEAEADAVRDALFTTLPGRGWLILYKNVNGDISQMSCSVTPEMRPTLAELVEHGPDHPSVLSHSEQTVVPGRQH